MRAVLRGLVLQLSTVALTPLALVTSYLTPLAIAFLVTIQVGHPTLAIVAGTIVAAILNTLVVQPLFAINDERMNGTILMLAAAPAGLLPPLIGRLLGALTQGLVAFPVTLLFVGLIWGPGALRDAAAGHSLALATVGLLAAAAGILAMAILHVALILRSFSYVSLVNAIFPVAVVAMCLFTSLSQLPPPLRALGMLLPPSWALESIRMDSYRPLLWCVVTTAGWALGGCWLLIRLPAWLRTAPQAQFR